MHNNYLKKQYIIIGFLAVLFVIPFFVGGAETGKAFFSTSIAAEKQKNIVSGVVLDSSGSPLQGANVLIKGTTISTRTNSNGEFKISLSTKSAELVISMLGFQTNQITVQVGDRPKITLQERVSDLEEVVVIGYGEVAKSDLTGAVGQVNMEDIGKAPVMSFEEALAGRVAGVQVTSGDGQPGADGPSIVVRGTGSLTQSTSPLYVVDGFPIEDFDASSLSMDDIESINVLKDASATAIYGARGANGVIVIETKQGKIGLPVISYSGSFGIQNTTNRMDMMTPFDFVKYQLDRTDNGISTLRRYTPGDLPEDHVDYDPNGKTLEGYRNIKGIDWQDRVFQQGYTGINTLSMRGGTKQTKYSLSSSLYNQQGVLINSGSNRFTGRLSLDQEINNRLKMRLTSSYSNQPSYGQVVASNASTAGHAWGYMMYSVWAFRPVTGLEGINGVDEDFIDAEWDEIAGADAFAINPVQTLQNEDRRKRRINFSTNVFLDWKIMPELLLKVSGSYNSSNQESTAFYNSKTNRGTPLNPTNSRGVQSTLSFSQRPDWKTSATLTYKRRFNKVHDMNLMGGVEYIEGISKRYGFGNQLIPEELLGLSGADNGVPTANTIVFSNNILASAFTRLNYNYRSKYLVTATMRADGSSKFAPGNRWGYFPSAAFSWRLSKEKFMRNLSVVNDAKLRLSYGTTGNNRVSDFAYLSTVTGSSIGEGYSFRNADPILGFYPGVLGNKNLRWETTKQFNVGLDLTMFKKRVEFVADIYRKNTTDLLLNANIPTHIGFSKSYKNIGALRNDGLELTLSTVNIKKRNFSWNSSFNISFNRNKILALTSDESRMLSAVTWDATHNGSSLYVAEVGEQAALFMGYIFDGIYQYEDFDELSPGVYVLKKHLPDNGSATREDVQPGDIKYRDINGDGTVNEFDETIIGNPMPKHVGGFSNNFSYKGLSVNVFFQWAYGFQIFNANRIYFEGGRPGITRNQFATYADRWTPENQSNTYFRARGGGPTGRYSSKYVEDGSYIRLKTIALAYQLPDKWFGGGKFIKKLSITANAQNLITWSRYSGMDPEVSTRATALTPGFDWSAYPRNRIWVFGIKSTL